MDDKNNKYDNIPELSEEVQSQLKQDFTTDSQLPIEVDRSVLEGARAHFDAVIKRRKYRYFRHLRYTAAMILVALSLTFVMNDSETYAAQDVNRDGSVDILDAMTLAIHIRDDGSFDQKWDFDNDKILTITDVAIVANKAVEINSLDSVTAGRIHSQLAMILCN